MRAERRRERHPSPWVAFAVVASAAFLLLTDVTIVNVAVPVIRADLDASYGDIQLVLSTYQLTFAIVLITGGRLGDLYGRRRMFLVGMCGFALASLLCGLSLSPLQLIAFRALQGLFAGLLFPQVLAILQTRFDDEDRGKAFGAYGGVVGFAVIAGPLLGGLLTELDLFGLSWRPIFLVNPLVGALGILGALRLLDESRAPRTQGLDLMGVALLTPALFLLVWPLVTARERGWPWWTFLLLASSLPLLALFFRLERRRTERRRPRLVDTDLFRSRGFSVGLALQLLFFFGVPVFFLCFVVFLQTGLGRSPLAAGLALTPFAVGEAVFSLFSSRVTRRIGARTLTFGALLVAVGLLSLAATLAVLGRDFNALAAAPSLFLAGAGVGTTVAPLITLVLAGIDDENAGSAAGVLSTMQRVGGATGVAAIGVVFFSLAPAGAVERGVANAGELDGFTHAMLWVALLEAFLYVVVAALSLLLEEPRVVAVATPDAPPRSPPRRPRSLASVRSARRRGRGRGPAAPSARAPSR